MPNNKYHAKRTWKLGTVFDSKHEADYYPVLLAAQQAGHITDLELQPRYDIMINGIFCGFYKADFRYRVIETGEVHIIDVKGYRTSLYRLKKKIVEALYGITIEEV